MEEGRWVSMVTCRAPTNIAVIKYWGKRHEKLILPLNSSLSLTLDPHHMSATTTVAASPSFASDRLWLNGKEVLISGERYQNCLREIRSRAEDVYDQIIGRLITKEEWKNLHVHIASVNNFPTAAGLASSAAGFACLVFALSQLMGVKEKYPGELSSIARMGSGSSCRSLYGGFVRWNMGKEDSGKDSVADQVADETHWKDLTVIIAVVSSREKETSSTSGMQESVHTSTLLPFRVKEVVPKRMVAMEDAIKKRDFSSFARITMADSNQFHAICLDSRPPIFYMNDASHRIISLVERWNQASKDPEVAYTFDAGPNAVMFARDRKTACLFLKQLVKSFPPASDADLASYVVGNPDIIKEACLESLESNEVPLTLGTFPSIPGQLKYIICTQQGEGPSVLPHSTSALLDSTTGLPF